MDKINKSLRLGKKELKKLDIFWQFGDWKDLLNEIQQLSNYHDLDEVTRVRKVVSLCQIGDFENYHSAVEYLRDESIKLEKILQPLMSGYAASISRCFLLDNNEDAAKYFIKESVLLDGCGVDSDLKSLNKLRYQAEQLDFLPWCIYKNDNYLFSKDKDDFQFDEFKSVEKDKSHLNFLIDATFNIIYPILRNEKKFKKDDFKNYKTDDPFFLGKFFLGVSLVLENKFKSLSERKKFCRLIARFTNSLMILESSSWGIYFFLKALYTFQKLGMLENIFNYSQLLHLQNTLNANDFVNSETLELINKPKNFYQVAFSISLLRFQLGWDDGKKKEFFLTKILEHIEASSPSIGFSDESDGKGCFDRYSVLLIAEVAHKFRVAGLPLTPLMKVWLRNSAEFILLHANTQGSGFQYGRSIGPYGDSAVNEILSAAAWFGLLNENELQFAFAFCMASTRRFIDFWMDKNTGLVDIWNAGRLTDDYRSSNRKLGETLSLLYQHIYTCNIWNDLGFDFSRSEFTLDEIIKFFSCNSKSKYYRLDNNDSEYGIYIFHLKNKMFTLPLVNAQKHHDKSFYLPIPYCNQLVQGIPNRHCNILVPKIFLQSGEELMPLSWFKKVNFSSDSIGEVLTFKQYKFDNVRQSYPTSNKDMRSETKYIFNDQSVLRVDSIINVREEHFSLSLMFLSFFKVSRVDGFYVYFTTGPIEKIRFKGYSEVIVEDVSNDPEFSSNERKYISLIRVEGVSDNFGKAVVEWEMIFRD